MITVYDSFDKLNYQTEEAFFATERISFLGPKIWNIVPNESKKEACLHAFKKLI